MNEILNWGLDVIKFIQGIRSDILDNLFLALTYMGDSIIIWLFKRFDL